MISRYVSLLLFLIVLSIGCDSNSQQRSVVGHWEGSLPIPSGAIRIFLHIDADSTGKLRATFDSPDQMAMQMPIATIDTSADSLTFFVMSAMGRYDGLYIRKNDEIHGQWMQGQSVMQLNFRRNDSVAFERPQEPKPPFPYRTEDITVDLDDGGKLAGMLTIPEGTGKFPLSILLTGSGSQNRDESIVGHKPFKVIADHLARNGIATLRFDDRGVGGSRSAKASVTMERLAKDVLLMIKSIQSHGSIDSSRIGLIGHSEGGVVATIAANKQPAIRFAVLMASPSIPLDSLLNIQYDKVMVDKPNAAMRRLQHGAMSLLKTTTDTAVLRRSLRELYMSKYDSLDEATKGTFPSKEAFASASLAQLMSPSLIFMIRFDPRTELAKLQIPVLALFGSNDIQVPVQENVSAMKDALKHNPRATVEAFPALNHLFQQSKTGKLSEYGTIKQTIAPEALAKITGWLKQR